MGLKINKQIYSRAHDEVFDSMYCRVESVTYQKVNGSLRYTLQFYHSEKGMEDTYPQYLGDYPVSESAVIPIETKMIVDSGSVSGSHVVYTNESGSQFYGIDIELPLFNRAYVTGSDEKMEDVYETREEVTDVMYTDYDEEGNLIEETRQETGSVKVKVGEKKVKKNFVKKNFFKTNTIYDYTYELAKQNLTNFFGEGTVEDIK